MCVCICIIHFIEIYQYYHSFWSVPRALREIWIQDIEWLLKSLFLDIKPHQNEDKVQVILGSYFYAKSSFLGLWGTQWLLSWICHLQEPKSSHYPSLPVFNFVSGRCHEESEPQIQLSNSWGQPNHFHFSSFHKQWQKALDPYPICYVHLSLGFCVLAQLEQLHLKPL